MRRVQSADQKGTPYRTAQNSHASRTCPYALPLSFSRLRFSNCCLVLRQDEKKRAERKRKAEKAKKEREKEVSRAFSL